MKEWPLTVFTLATQFACGLALAATAFDASAGAAGAEPMRPLAMAIFPLVAAGVLGSIAHLGRPLKSWRAVANLRQSPLSREILLMAVFALLAFAYSASWWMGSAGGRMMLGAATGIAGLLAVLASAAVYTVPAQPAWNSGWLPTSFLGTAVLLGGLAPTVLIPWRGNAGVLLVFLSATVAGSLLLLAAALWMLTTLSRGASDPFTAARLTDLRRSLVSRNSFWLGCHLALASVLPIAVAVWLWPNGPAKITAFAAPVLTAVLLGSATGRAVMYWLGTRYEPF